MPVPHRYPGNASGVLRRVRPVSYTHLDVYKRQVYRPVEYMAVSDAFSTESETVLTQQQVALEEVADVFTQQVEAVTCLLYTSRCV